MPLHLVKLCVGADSIADLEGWIAGRLAAARARKLEPVHAHVTRMAPRRAGELLDGGSLFWVIKGQIAARQTLLGVTPFVDADGVGRCRLTLEPIVAPVVPVPRRPFQGWRYLEHADAPPDLSGIRDDRAVMPEPLRRELRGLGLL